MVVVLIVVVVVYALIGAFDVTRRLERARRQTIEAGRSQVTRSVLLDDGRRLVHLRLNLGALRRRRVVMVSLLVHRAEHGRQLADVIAVVGAV